jgi:ubiquinone/menaquinone biosynthesis C-methylase UbiE
MRRIVIPELLDTDAGTPDEIKASLADLRMINRYFGGTRVMRRLVEHVAKATGAHDLSLLDVAAGSGDIVASVKRDLRPRGIQLHTVLLDQSAVHMPREACGVVGNALALPFRDDSFDLVSCSLFAHHLEPGEFLIFVNEALRVCRRAVLINDLRRNAMHLAMFYAGMPLYRSFITRHDGVASVRRAYTPAEMRAMLAQSNAARIEMWPFYLFRMGVVAWKASKQALG